MLSLVKVKKVKADIALHYIYFTQQIITNKKLMLHSVSKCHLYSQCADVVMSCIFYRKQCAIEV